jgi:dimethylglycine dehydrogenase
MDIGMVPAMVGRITFTGDLGYELWVKPEYQCSLFDALWEAGRAFGMKPFGSRALLSLAREKNFGTWAREFRPIYGPYEADLGRFVDLTKNDFIGRAGAAEEKEKGPKRRRVSFVVDANNADAIGDEAVWRNGEVVGWITSGGYCHHAGCSLAMGYVPSEALNGSDGSGWEIEILGERRKARLQLTPLFDPQGARLRS